MDEQPNEKKHVVFAIEWTNVLFPHTWLEDIMQTKKVFSSENDGALQERRLLKILDFSEAGFLSDDYDGKDDAVMKLSREESSLYRLLQQEVRKTLAMCLEMGRVRVITTLGGRAETHEKHATKVEEELFTRWTGLDTIDLYIMPEMGSQRKFQEREFSSLIKEELAVATDSHFVSIGSDINYRNATFACKPRPVQVAYHAVSMGDHQYDLGYHDLGFFRDRSAVSCENLIDQHRVLQKHLRSIVSNARSACKREEDIHLDAKKAISIHFQKDLSKLEPFLQALGKRKTEELPSLSYGKHSSDYFLSMGEIKRVDTHFAEEKVKEQAILFQDRMSVISGLVQVQVDINAPSRFASSLSVTDEGQTVAVAMQHGVSVTKSEAEQQAAEEQLKKMREARLKMFCS